MEYKTFCPICDTSISVWRLILSRSPSNIRCPHCKRQIRVKNFPIWSALVALVVTGSLGGIFIAEVIFRNFTGGAAIGLAIFVTIIFAIACDITLVLWAVNNGKFVPVKQ